MKFAFGALTIKWMAKAQRSSNLEKTERFDMWVVVIWLEFCMSFVTTPLAPA